MKGVVEALVFAGASAALHLAAFTTWNEAPGAEPGAGASGDAVLTLAAAPPSLSARVEEWQTAPQVPTDAPERTTPDQQASVFGVPNLDAGPALARGVGSAPPTPSTERSAALDTRLPEPPKPKEPERVEQVQETPAPATPRKQEKAKGAAKTPGSSAGSVSPQRAAAPQASKAALANWGAQIRARIERRKKSPRGSWSSGSATLRIKVARDGGLAGLGVLKSSGDSRLDRAALDAVKRAGRFPAAPQGFSKATMTFDLPVSFVR